MTGACIRQTRVSPGPFTPGGGASEGGQSINGGTHESGQIPYGGT